MALIKRQDKGQALTYNELDGNFTHLGGDGSYQFPATDGTTDQVLTTDGNGQLVFKDIDLNYITGDLKGSVFADDSTLLVDGVAGEIVGNINNSLTNTETLTAETLTAETLTAETLTAETLTVNGLTTLTGTTEVLNTKTGATGTVAHNFSPGAVFYHSSIAADFTANFTNVPTTNDRTISVVLILSQGATAYMPTALQIDSSAATIVWQGGSAPSGTASGTDIVSFTLIRTGSAWTVLGSATSYS